MSGNTERRSMTPLARMSLAGPLSFIAIRNPA